jgi:hypothetical protein
MYNFLLVANSNKMDFSNLKAFGAFVIVMILLLLSLKLLSKINAGQKSAAGSIVYSASAGPNRTIEHIKSSDKIHVIYKNGESMVLLETISLEDYHKPEIVSAKKMPLGKFKLWK